ncbi:type II toxin-antitoxin system HicA family toxin [Patescibacteria group bacterium]|nr:type II toxin-antitoxin system HicA family toxin [Patescibacteria group bacterium]MBU4580240.1 type II toxin-antitoxin system HicA family toxin [Patescibacteria group bacterium]
MPKLYSSNEIIKVLQKQGFVYISQKGSHMKFKKIGTFKSILRQSNLIEDDFRKK